MFYSFTQKYPPVKFLSEKDRKRILVSWHLLGGCFGEVPKILWNVICFVGLKTWDGIKGITLGVICVVQVLGQRFTYLHWCSQTQHIINRLGLCFWSLICQLNCSPCNFSGSHFQGVSVCAPRWLKLAETGKLFKHILAGTLCDQIGQNLVIRLEKKLLCREWSSLCIFSVVSVILKHHKQLRVEGDGRLSQEK